jgi:hypothetical protein
MRRGTIALRDEAKEREMSLKNMLGNVAGKALFISLAGACAIGGIPVKAASAATLEELYRTQFVVRNCQYDFTVHAPTHSGSDFEDQPEDTEEAETVDISKTEIGRLSVEVESAATFLETTPEQYDAIFSQLNSEIAQDVEAFCATSIPVANEVFSSF